jgi:hypothetical protein
LESALQGLCEFYDSPSQQSTAALLAIMEASSCLDKTDISFRCANILDVLRFEEPMLLPEHTVCLWAHVSRSRALLEDTTAPALHDVPKPNASLLPTPLRMTLEISSAIATMLALLRSKELSQDEKLQLSFEESSRLAMTLEEMESDMLVVSPLQFIAANFAQAYFLFRQGKVQCAVERFEAAVCTIESSGVPLMVPMLVFVYRMLIRTVQFTGGAQSLVERAKAHLVPWAVMRSRDVLAPESTVLPELIACILREDSERDTWSSV